jgi:hypothetical protein
MADNFRTVVARGQGFSILLADGGTRQWLDMDAPQTLPEHIALAGVLQGQGIVEELPLDAPEPVVMPKAPKP